MIHDNYRNRRSTTPDEKSIAVDKWLAKLTILGIDPTKPFAKSIEYLNRSQTLRAGNRTAQTNYDDLARDIANQLADGTTTVANIGDEINKASLAIANEERVRTIVGLASRRATSRAFDTFNLGEDKMVGLLRPLAAELIEKIRTNAMHVPSDIHVADDAMSAGRDTAKAWIEINADMNILNELHDLADDWRANFFIPVEDVRAQKYHPQQFRWANPAQLDAKLYGPRGREEAAVAWLIRNLDAGPAILSVSEVDTLSARELLVPA